MLQRICSVLVLYLSFTTFSILAEELTLSSFMLDLIKKSESYASSDAQEAIRYLRSREEKVLRDGNALEKASFYNMLCGFYGDARDFKKQFECAKRGIQYVEAKQLPIRAKLLYQLGFSNELIGNHAEALKHYTEAIQLAKALDLKQLIAEGHSFIGSYYADKNKYADALEHLKKAYKMSLDLDDPELTGTILSSLGNLYSYLGDDEQSLMLHKKSLELAKEVDNLEEEITSLYNLAATYTEMKDFQQAAFYYDQMLQRSKLSENKANLYFSYAGLAEIFLVKGKEEVALSYIDEAEVYLKHVQEYYFRTFHFIQKAQILKNLGQIEHAVMELNKAKVMTEKEDFQNVQNLILNIQSLTAKLQAQLGEWEEAYKAQQKYFELYVKAHNKDTKRHVEKLKIKFDTERRETENKILEQDNAIQRLRLKEAQWQRRLQWMVVTFFAMTTCFFMYVILRQRRSRRLLAVLAETDSLTELHNRRFIYTKAEKLFKELRSKGITMSVIIFDIDLFKSINDQYGHATGDDVLRWVASSSKQQMREKDILARIGGEEFLAVLPNVEHDVALHIAERLRLYLAHKPREFNGHMFKVTASFGVATWSETVPSFDQLVANADGALYRAKESGRNNVKAAEVDTSASEESNMTHAR